MAYHSLGGLTRSWSSCRRCCRMGQVYALGTVDVPPLVLWVGDGDHGPFTGNEAAGGCCGLVHFGNLLCGVRVCKPYSGAVGAGPLEILIGPAPVRSLPPETGPEGVGFPVQPGQLRKAGV